MKDELTDVIAFRTLELIRVIEKKTIDAVAENF